MPSSPSPSAPRHDATDEAFMREALRLAKLGEGAVEPNPMVGCVLVRDGQVIGKGYHRRFGGPHAEIDALQSLKDRSAARGATAYVTLEPCCHHGKTPPCAQALIDAGVDRVILAMQDPFPRVDGGGVKQLNEAGIATSAGLLQSEAEQLLAPYLKRTRTGMPWVIAKWAMSIDGRIATIAGESQWITGERSRAEVHQLRGRVDAILVGMGTVEADDPLLTARPAAAAPLRVAHRAVFCAHRLPRTESQLVRTAAEVPVLLIVAPTVDAAELATLQSRGCDVIRCGVAEESEMVLAALKELAQGGHTNIMLEGGSRLLGSFLAAGQIDECHVFMGGKAIGGQRAPAPIGGVGIASIAAVPSMTLLSLTRFDDDVYAVYRKA